MDFCSFCNRWTIIFHKGLSPCTKFHGFFSFHFVSRYGHLKILDILEKRSKTAEQMSLGKCF